MIGFQSGILCGWSTPVSFDHRCVRSRSVFCPENRSNARYNRILSCANNAIAQDCVEISQVAVIGGGAAGFFAAIECARVAEPNVEKKVIIFEALPEVLTKVKISGGGRCNVTHHEFDPQLLGSAYPRSRPEMAGPFANFDAQSAVNWFEKAGVPLKTESDGRIFPVSDNSKSVTQALVREAERFGVIVITNARVVDIRELGNGANAGQYRFEIDVIVGKRKVLYRCERVLMSPGASRIGYSWAERLGHQISSPVPSLFTFKVHDSRLEGLAGVSVSDTKVQIVEKGSGKSSAKSKRRRTEGLVQRGITLITHWGFSGPAILRLSAFGARVLHENGYRMELVIDWRPKSTITETFEELKLLRMRYETKSLLTFCPLTSRAETRGEEDPILPRRLWRALVISAVNSMESGKNSELDKISVLKWSEISNGMCKSIAEEIHNGRFQVLGKGQFKEEFVTCGGVKLKDVNMKTMESKIINGLYFAGEFIDVDAITGGFNLQAAWTTGYIAGRSMRESLLEKDDG